MIRRYLQEIETAALILVVIGIIISHVWGYNYGVWPCSVGLVLWLIAFLYRAFHWQEYARQNKQNIIILLVAIIILFLQMIFRQ